MRGADLEEGQGVLIRKNYYEQAMIKDCWSKPRRNHHAEATNRLYAGREAGRVMVEEGLEARFARHRAAGAAMSAGLRATGPTLHGQHAHRATHVTGVHIPGRRGGARGPVPERGECEIESGPPLRPRARHIWPGAATAHDARPPQRRSRPAMKNGS